MIKEIRFREIVDSYSSIDNVLVIGDSGIDRYTSGTVDRISPEAPIPVLKVVKQQQKLGLSANVCHNLKALGINTKLCSVVGNDERAKDLRELLFKLDISCDGLIEDKNRETTLKERVVCGQQICRIDYEVLESIDKEVEDKMLDYLPKAIKESSAIIVQDYCKGVITYNLIKSIIKLAEGKMVAIDPGLNTDANIYKGAYLIKPNYKEAVSMSKQLGYKRDGNDLKDLAEFLLKVLELQAIVITLGAKGMAVLGRDSKFTTIKTVAYDVYDVSGAGDTTISLLISSLVVGASLKEAAWIGNCGAGVVVGKRQTATVTTDELMKFYLLMSKLGNF